MTDTSKNKKTDAEWQSLLSPELYHIARQSGTESPFSGTYNDTFEDGIYHCACCDEPLFCGTTKFPTQCGWPGFAKPMQNDTLQHHADYSIAGRPRTEVRCTACDAHLGHVFDDGPAHMGGLRYCINSLSLILKKP